MCPLTPAPLSPGIEHGRQKTTPRPSPWMPKGYLRHHYKVLVSTSGYPSTMFPLAAQYICIITCIPRHPDAAQRPSAANISHWLSRPDSQLLRWSDEDRAVHPRASLLGAELEATVELYKELQESYINQTL